MRRKLSLVMAAALTAALLGGCAGGNAKQPAGDTTAAPTTAAQAEAGSTEAEETEAEKTEAAKADDKKAGDSAKTGDGQFKAALIVTGSVNDAGWNAAAYNGMKAIESEMGAEINFSENVSLPDAEPALRDFSNKGYNLVFAHSMEYGESVTKIAGDYPDTKYAVYTGTVEADNVASISLNEHETGYLAGMLAASMSKTGKIGVIIGSDLPPMIRIAEAYKLGAKEINPDIQVFDVFAGSWDDIAKGKEAALGQIENGADVIFHVADKTGLGAIQAAQEKGVYAIGSSVDQSAVAPGTVLSSALDHADKAYLAAAKSVSDGTFKGGIMRMGLKEEAIGMAPYDAAVPEDVIKKIEDKTAQIVNGEFEVPEILERTTK